MKPEQVTIHPGSTCPALGNGQRIVRAEIGRKWVKVWLPHRKTAKRVSRKLFDLIRVEDSCST